MIIFRCDTRRFAVTPLHAFVEGLGVALLLPFALATAASAQPTESSQMAPADQLRAAAVDAFGTSAPVTQTRDGKEVVVKAEQVVWTRLGPVLIASVTMKQGCEDCTGGLDIYYFEDSSEGLLLRRKFPDAIEGSSAGKPPIRWSLDDRFLGGPVLRTVAEGAWQGCTTTAVSLTELTPDGPVARGSAPIGWSDASGDDKAVGRIANIVRGKSFDIVYSGTRAFTDHYQLANGAFSMAGEQRLSGCARLLLETDRGSQP